MIDREVRVIDSGGDDWVFAGPVALAPSGPERSCHVRTLEHVVSLLDAAGAGEAAEDLWRLIAVEEAAHRAERMIARWDRPNGTRTTRGELYEVLVDLRSALGEGLRRRVR